MIRRAALHAIPTMVGVVIVSFLMLHLMPGDAVDALAGISGGASAETVAAMRSAYGLDDPLGVQLARYAAGVFTLDFGHSISYGAPVFDVIVDRLPATLLLAATAFTIALVIGVAAGWAMAVFADRWQDRTLSAGVLFLYSAPSFWVGLMAIVVFSAKLNLFPLGGAETIGADLTGWALVADRLHHLILPASALAAFFVAIYARLTRAAMLEVLHQDFIRTARAKGLHPLRLQFRHGLRNALIPVVTMAGLHFGNLVGGAVVVETVFNWPGLGRLTMGALASRDISVLLGILLMTSVVVIAANILIDWLVARLDPRVSA
ncbi:ABC transporter permease [Falsirhodobacter xinxiangensis]|uniref:ABC transporter permease n=1 Tax=Falsirhodobacter xinxiangensis TaxID=2530049 RepID=UPI0010AA8FDD|nr:ABC transporter permease [Rhodobacter xinxiangensis]